MVERVAGVEAAGDVGAGDDVEQGVVVAQPPDAEALAEVGVEVDRAASGRAHRRSLAPSTWATCRHVASVSRSGRWCAAAAGYRGRRGPGRRRRGRPRWAGGAAARLAAAGHAVTVLEQAAQVGGKLGWFARDGFTLRHRPVPADPARGLPRPVRRDRRTARGVLDLVPARPGRAPTGSPTARELPCPAHPAGSRRPRSTTRSAPAPAPSGRRCWTAPQAMWRVTREPFLESPLRGRRPSPGWPAAPPTCAPSPRGGPCAGSAAGTCATRACACCSTATPPTPAPTRGGPRPRWLTVPYVEQTFGSWYVRGGLRRLGRGGARPGASSGAPSCAPAPRVARGRWSRAAGPPGCGWPTASVCRPTSSSANADAARSTRDLLPPAPARPALRRAAPGDAVAVGLRAAAGPARPHPGPGAPHRAVPARLRRRVRRRVRPARAAATGRRPDGLRQRARRPGAAAGRRTRVVVRAGQRAAARPGAARRRLGRARARPTRTPTGCST